MKKKSTTILLAVMLTISAVALLPTGLGSPNNVASSTMYFEGNLTYYNGGMYTGVLKMTLGDYYVPGGPGETISTQGGFDVFGKEGEDAMFGDDNDGAGGNPPVWTPEPIVDHDAWPTWNPDTPDWYQYSLNLYMDGGNYRWALRNHPGATADHPWYDTAHWGAEKPPMGVPMSGPMDWTTLYATETDIGEYLPGTGTPEIPGGAAAQGGGPQAWDMDWSWGSEVVPLEFEGFTVDVTELPNGEYRVIMTPEAAYSCLDSGIETTPQLSTNVTITGGGNNTGNGAPIIKCKWEYDLNVSTPIEECPSCSICDEGDGLAKHDACPCTDGLQVKPILGGDVTIEYFAVITDPEGIGQVDHVYCDVWHPDGTFKYQIEMIPISNITQGLDIWDHVTNCHPDLITYNGYNDSEIYDELWEGLAEIYHAKAQLNYCQPGGWYYVGIRAHDTYDAWCDYLYNKFWYIPTSAVEVDFTNLNYGTVATSVDKWIGGDNDMNTAEKPTVRNIGNTPVELYVWQDDMDFGKTNGSWNVEFDARLGNPGLNGDVGGYYPEEMDPDHLGVRIPGILPLCTKEKMDFSIHVYKGMPGLTYTGSMKLCAYIDHGHYVWDTPAQFLENAPNGVPDPYEGPVNP